MPPKKGSKQPAAAKPAEDPAPEDPDAAEEEDPDFVPEGANLQQLLGGANPELIAAMQAGLARMVGTSSGYLEGLPAPVRARIAYLEELQEEHEELEEKYEEEMAALEEKYKALTIPLMEKRRDVVTGKADAPDNDTDKARAEIKSAKVAAGIPDFWLGALRNHPELEEMISDKDAEVLSFLTDVRAEELVDEEGDDDGFKLTFAFAENPFFSNSELTLTYLLEEDRGYMSVRALEGCDVAWRSEDKNVTVKRMKKKPKAGSKAKPLTKLEPVESFFRMFTDPPEVPEPEEVEQLGEEEAEQLQEEAERFVAIGELIKEDILPKAVKWFTGAALAEMEEEESEEDEEGEDYDDDDGEDEDDEDSEDDDDAPPGVPTDAGEKPQECKQQ